MNKIETMSQLEHEGALAAIARGRRVFSLRYSVAIIVLAVLPFFVIAAIGYGAGVQSGSEILVDKNCVFQPLAFGLYVLIVAILVIQLRFVWKRLKLGSDRLGIFEDYSAFVRLTVGNFLLFALVSFSIPLRVRPFPPTIFLWAIAQIWLVYSVIVPAYRIIWPQSHLHLLRTSPSQPEMKFDLRAYLQDRDSFALFQAHVELEYSAENLAFWKAVRDFKAAPSFARVVEIIARHIAENAPFEVNISAKTKRSTLEQAQKLFLWEWRERGWDQEAKSWAEWLERNGTDQLVAMMRRASSGLAIRSVDWGLRSFPQCFTGAEVVDWLVRYAPLAPLGTRGEMRAFAARLIELRVIEVVRSGAVSAFKDSDASIYRFPSADTAARRVVEMRSSGVYNYVRGRAGSADRTAAPPSPGGKLRAAPSPALRLKTDVVNLQPQSALSPGPARVSPRTSDSPSQQLKSVIESRAMTGAVASPGVALISAAMATSIAAGAAAAPESPRGVPASTDALGLFRSPLARTKPTLTLDDSPVSKLRGVSTGSSPSTTPRDGADQPAESPRSLRQRRPSASDPRRGSSPPKPALKRQSSKLSSRGASRSGPEAQSLLLGDGEAAVEAMGEAMGEAGPAGAPAKALTHTPTPPAEGSEPTPPPVAAASRGPTPVASPVTEGAGSGLVGVRQSPVSATAATPAALVGADIEAVEAWQFALPWERMSVSLQQELLELFDDMEADVMMLMEGDTLRRFLESPGYQTANRPGLFRRLTRALTLPTLASSVSV
eukprot:TRINITY_DN7312_c0_g1_i14.p1 TRINITY_DN7312_c0_g1~~TRINITY_DN7312_c0_g1_i14.p1  ORF type:complete len:892 (-),score=158.71 TRINITY_DN7312_c0_g1_i14:31-2352(-)